MFTNLIYILLAIVLLGLIVTVHEFGHYCVGRLCGIGIVEFSVGFGPRLFGWERKGIKYSLRAIPLGGYCAFVGEDEQNSDPKAMNNQPVWKRFLTTLAGPFMNFVLAFLACAIMLDAYIIAENLPVVDTVVEDLPAAAAGLQKGDVVTSANGVEITKNGAGLDRLVEIIRGTEPGESVSLTVARGSEVLSLTLQTVAAVDEDTNKTHGLIGVKFSGRTYTFFEALRESGSYMFDVTRSMLDSLRRLFFHGEGVKDVTGAVGIIAVVSQTMREGMYQVLWLMFIISLNLGIMNLLPFPALDGGRLLFLIVEAIRGKPIPPEKEGLVHGIGLLLIFGLFVVLMFHDVIGLFNGRFSNL